ncbi:MAG: hypothetical protein JO351_08505 [Candidatus Eremiobacteraeota bacterium]|nr:hypothetical protein [Candidatus Eremiobacteraeota bacterium]
MRVALPVVAILLAAACGQQAARNSLPGIGPAVSQGAQRASAPGAPAGAISRLLGGGKISHVVIVIQENRTTDNLFNGLPGADTVQAGSDSTGGLIKLQPEPLTAQFDVDHEHAAFEVAFNGGKLNGFNLERSACRGGRHHCPRAFSRAYSYVPHKGIEPYFDLAKTYAFGDRMFQTNEGPSFPAHQYLLSGTSTIAQGSPERASENPFGPHQQFTGGCDSSQGSLVLTINAKGSENEEVYPCFDRPALTDLIEAKSLSWRYYQAHGGAGLWNAPDAIRHIRFSPQYSTDVIHPPSQFLADVARGSLANVTWVTPTAKASDHAGITDGSGPSWVAAVVNAVGKSSFWKSTAILVTWDDWGGWYDHVQPPQYDAYELGFRVPLIIISPYSKRHFVSHKQYEFGSILKFAEHALGLPTLGATDIRSDDLSDCFNFLAPAAPFREVSAPLPASYFLKQPPSDESSPDDDF